jgi:hypothetical protein
MNHFPVKSLGDDFPLELSSIYSGHSRNRFAWLTRVGPDGHKGRFLWVLVAEFNDWCRNRGVKYRLEVQDGMVMSDCDRSTPIEVAPNIAICK